MQYQKVPVEDPVISPMLQDNYEIEQNDLRKQLRDKQVNPGPSPLAMVLGLACFPFTLLGSWYTLNQNEEAVVLSYGRYSETVQDPGINFSNMWGREIRKISTKQQSIELPKTTVVDSNGNPLIISAVIVYRISNSRRALLDVENSRIFVKNQAEAALKQTLSRFPYESNDGSPCLKTEAEQIGKHLCNLLQRKVLQAGAMVDSFQLKEISYAPEIASGMLKRQQAIAIIEARQTIVQGAVDIAADAVTKLAERGIELSDSDQAKLVTNLLTVVCSDNDAQPTVPM
mmetsp:Transcript_130599/g.194536  ORF Transcript_130599/g.194536 Transcript_130599/m.194536 type:complete len:286 (+) Transcript_130599:34-891(+)